MLQRRLIYVLVVVALLGGMAFAMITTAVQQSPTIDEPVYVGTAEVYAQQHSLRYNPEHPPLGKLVMAVGLGFEHATLDPSYQGNQTLLGRHLLYESGNNPFRLMLAARLPIIVLTLAFGLVVLAFARDLAGPWAGLAALVLYAFDPDLIAQGSLATLDVPAAGLLITTFWLLWRARARPGWYLPLAGVALGAALATRMSTLPAVPVALLLVLLFTRRRRIASVLGVGAIAVAVVWAVYLIVDPHLRWTTPAGVHNPGGLKGLAVDLLPFPAAYRDGVLVQFQFESDSFNGFLLGHAYHGRLWYYLPVALVIKTPLGMMALWAVGAVTMLAKRSLRVASLYLLLPAAVLFAVAMTGARDFGTRYVIFMPMFGAVVASTALLIRRRQPSTAAEPELVPAVAASALSGSAVSHSGSGAPRSGSGIDSGSGIGLGSDVDPGSGIDSLSAVDEPVPASDKSPHPAPFGKSEMSPSARPGSVVGVAVAALLAFVAVSSVRTFPLYIPYENEAFGGPSRTHLHLHDSNVDWGQDLPRLATRLKDRYPGQTVWLVYKGSGVPAYYGINGADPLTGPIDQVHGLLVVSDSRVALATGRLKQLIDSSTPIDEVGYSMTIYRR